MGRQSYDYATREGVAEISWEGFGELVRVLAAKLGEMGVEVIVGTARAGLFPATAVACSLRRELFPVRVTRRVNDEVVYEKPVWKVDVSTEVAGKVVAVVDEMADTGETLALVAQRVRQQGAAQVITASLVSHSWAEPMPEVTGLVTDALVLFPWDKMVWLNGRWQPHPELAEALQHQQKDE
ncbi:MAG: phosphoribosyltransferase [Ardenticatenaceae bacterium]|nr:phosphoribosyltransferase [Ardenticatenaceae bacterium]